jgi:hypothetical protein
MQLEEFGRRIFTEKISLGPLMGALAYGDDRATQNPEIRPTGEAFHGIR